MSRYVFDIETNPLDFKTGDILSQVHTCHCLVIYNLDSKKLWSYYDTDETRRMGTAPISAGLRLLQDADELIGHNIIQFDLPVLRKLFDFRTTGSITDTLVTSRLFYPDRPGGHSLREWGERLGAAKGEPGSFEEFSPSLLEYCEQDVKTNVELYHHLLRERKEHKRWGPSLEMEHSFAEIIAQQERTGFKFNSLTARMFTLFWDYRMKEISDVVLSNVPDRPVPGLKSGIPYKINGDLSKPALRAVAEHDIDPSTIGGRFQGVHWVKPDLDSHVQLKEVLLKLGWKPIFYTEASASPQIEDRSLYAMGPIGVMVSERNRLKTWRDRVKGFLGIADADERVHGGGNPCGTPTGRMRHSRIANIPRITSPFGRELRSLFRATPGNVLVGYDAAALELRILAHYIGSEEYAQAVCTEDKSQDAHVLAAEATGSNDRDLGKTINYALIYGAGDRRLGDIIGGTTQDGSDLRRRLYKKIPGLQSLVNHVKTASNRGYLIGLDGRRLYLRPRIAALNTLIQGGGAIFMKTAAVRLDQQVKQKNLKAQKVLDMHDEAQWDCVPEEVETIEQLIHESFEWASQELKLRCPQKAEIKTGSTWRDTH